MIATLFDYGAGNLHSLAKALDRNGVPVRIEADPTRLAAAELIVLPGVGAFGSAAGALAPGRLALRSALDAGLPCIGICLGMQLLFDSSEEGQGEGLGVIAGRVTALNARRVPQIGWNALDDPRDPAFTAAPLATAYFANGFACRPEDLSVVIAWSTHEADRFPAAVKRGRVMGIQFHPEKSSDDGVRFLGACVREVTR